MNSREFLNVLKSLSFIDRREFDAALPPLSSNAAANCRWVEFSDDPARWLTRAPDHEAAAVFALADDFVNAAAVRLVARARGECVHHIDGNPHNNDLANLCIIPKEENDKPAGKKGKSA